MNIFLKTDKQHKLKCDLAKPAHVETCGLCYNLKARRIINRVKKYLDINDGKGRYILSLSLEEKELLFHTLMKDRELLIELLLPFWDSIKKNNPPLDPPHQPIPVLPQSCVY